MRTGMTTIMCSEAQNLKLSFNFNLENRKSDGKLGLKLFHKFISFYSRLKQIKGHEWLKRNYATKN